jgi:hypothetical protein
MTEAVQLPAGTKLAQGNDGIFFPVADDDPRVCGEIINGITIVEDDVYGGPLICYDPKSEIPLELFDPYPRDDDPLIDD